MKKVRTIVTTGVASLGLVVGLSGFAGATSGVIDTTGPWSENIVRHKTKNKVEVENNNHVNATNTNRQSADSGDAEVKYNTTGGAARSGNASNANALNATVAVSNSGSAAGGLSMAPGNNSGTIRNTGPHSYNKVVIKHKNEVTVTNNNHLNVTNNNSQHADSGDATVQGNTTGGSATTGNATNTNTTTMNLRVTN